MIILMKKNKSWRRLLTLFGALLCMLTSCQFGGNQQEKQKDDSKAENGEKPKTAEEGSGTNQNNQNGKKDNPTTKKEKENAMGIKKKDSKASKRNYNFIGWGIESSNQYWNNLKEVAESAGAYYKTYASQFRLISKNGKMYHSNGEQYVGIQYLCKNAGLSQSLIDFSCDVILMKGKDLAVYDGTDVPEGSMGFGVFTAVRQPSGDKIMISSPEGKIGTIAEEEYRSLLKKYNQEHGYIRKMAPGAPEYERILNFIRVYDGRFDKYFVREVRTDNKYAFVTLSPQTNPLDIKQYILVNDNSFWEVVIDGLEKEYNLNVSINKVLPDFNLRMLPNYNITEYKNDLKADYADVFKNMIYNGFMLDSSQVYYKSGTADYCYLVLYSGKRYYGVRKGGNWDIRKVSSAGETYRLMTDVGGGVPTFIILDD